uniref:Uncharacterized protein n=1 Tax=Nicotiana tabacum TaxID=4097 RepID=A0A1S4AXR7_TOBAC|nr:PREDICTED: uncharacterized protein LOC107802440 [Nicotiana tabacum]
MEKPPERWARSSFPRRRYDMLTTNMVESMNSVLLKAREMPILRMLDFIQEKLGEWFYERRKKAHETFHKVSIWAEEEMYKKVDLACKIFKSDYCSKWYSRETWFETYEGHVNTVADQNSWDIPQNVESEITKSPDVEILQGRSQKKRHIPATESVPLKSTKCSRCKQIGHNRTTCLSSTAPHSYSKKYAEKYSNVQ